MKTRQIIINDYLTKQPFAAAKGLESLPAENVASFLKSLSLEKNIELLVLMNPKNAAEALQLIPSKRSNRIIETLDSNILATIFKFIDLKARSKLLIDVSSNKTNSIKRHLSYLPNSIATLMEPPDLVNKEMTVGNTLQIFKNSKEKKEFYLYVINLKGKFIGIVRLKELFLSQDPSINLEEIIITSIPFFLPDITIEDSLDNPAWLEFQELPVLSTSGELLGKLTRKNLFKQARPEKRYNYDIEETSQSLGELFKIGINGLLKSGVK